jgi:hypothetical protein
MRDDRDKANIAARNYSEFNHEWRKRADAAEATVATLTAQVEAMRGEPIETAPRNGTMILVFFRRKGWRAVTWEDPWGEDPARAIWCVNDDKHGPYPLRGYMAGDDTHWMPMPIPPAALTTENQTNG